MAKKEVKTDLWVYELLNEADIHLTPLGCDILEISEALKTASKSGKGNVYYRKESFVRVINTGLMTGFSIGLSFNDIKTKLVKLYNAA